jgi:L-threonylcarbamoyladenylate synthase
MQAPQETIQQAITIASGGGIIIYPTDTAFGIGCRIDNHAAVTRLFTIRRRPVTQAIPALVSSQSMALAYFDNPSDIVRRLMKKYWPGALTIIAPCKKDLIYSPIRGNRETVGLRMPDHQTILKIIQGVGVPVLGPSANFHQDPTPYRIEDLNSELIGLVDYVVPGVCSVRLASTVVDCSVQPCKIIRQGAVKI